MEAALTTRDPSGGAHAGRKHDASDGSLPAQSRPSDPQPGIAVDDAWSPERFLKPPNRHSGWRRAALAAAALGGVALAIVAVASIATRDAGQPLAIATSPAGVRGDHVTGQTTKSSQRSRATLAAESKRGSSRAAARVPRSAASAQAKDRSRRRHAATRSRRARRSRTAAPRPAPVRPAAAAPGPPAPAPRAPASLPCEFPPC
jgi:hypothetical protein